MSSDWFRVVFPRGTVNGTVNGTLSDIEIIVLSEMKKNPSVTYDELVNVAGKSRRTVVRIVDSLKERNFVKRVGSDKTGHWMVLD